MAPDNERLERMIQAAFAQLPEPSPARLKAVEDGLVLGQARRAKRYRPRWYWWLMAALVATGTAAWWSEVRQSSQNKQDASPEVTVEVAPSGQRHGSQPTGSENAAPVAADEKRSPTIYRRERP